MEGRKPSTAFVATSVSLRVPTCRRRALVLARRRRGTCVGKSGPDARSPKDYCSFRAAIERAMDGAALRRRAVLEETAGRAAAPKCVASSSDNATGLLG